MGGKSDVRPCTIYGKKSNLETGLNIRMKKKTVLRDVARGIHAGRGLTFQEMTKGHSRSVVIKGGHALGLRNRPQNTVARGAHERVKGGGGGKQNSPP